MPLPPDTMISASATSSLPSFLTMDVTFTPACFASKFGANEEIVAEFEPSCLAVNTFGLSAMIACEDAACTVI